MSFTRLTAAVISVLTLVVSGYFFYTSFTQWKELPDLKVAQAHGGHGSNHSAKDEHSDSKKEASHGDAASAGEHGASTNAEHGAAPAGEHGASVSAEHGAAPSGEHGAAPSGEHGAKSDGDPLVVSLDEFFINLGSESEPDKLFSLGLKMELQLFEGADDVTVRRSASGIRHTIIETSRNQDYFHLKTTAGKLYFKELLIKRINAFLNAASVRDVRFAQLLFQR